MKARGMGGLLLIVRFADASRFFCLIFFGNDIYDYSFDDPLDDWVKFARRCRAASSGR